jgi:hypothetical protein
MMQTRFRSLSCIFPLMLFSGSLHAVGIEAWQTVVEADGVQRVNISCGTNFFDPREIVVKKDVPLDVIVRTTANLPQQNFVVRLPGPSLERIVGRVPQPIRFLPNILGQFAILCQTPGVPEDQRTQAKKSGILSIVP